MALDYPLTRPFPGKYFAPAAFLGAFVVLVFLTTINGMDQVFSLPIFLILFSRPHRIRDDYRFPVRLQCHPISLVSSIHPFVDAEARHSLRFACFQSWGYLHNQLYPVPV
jgi:hypothetical protein